MTRSQNGRGRHRQVWRPVVCPSCSAIVEARPTLPGRPWALRPHFDGMALCDCLSLDEKALRPA